MFCKYCGAEITDDSVFCSSCGKNVKTEGKSVTTKETNNEPSRTWLFRDDFQRGGPCTYNEMVLKIKKREIDFDGEVKVSGEESNEWVPLKQSVFASTIKEMPARQICISDKWVWCLAILPMLIPIVIRKLGLLSSLNTYEWIISLILNIVFLMLDKREIEEAGFFESWSYLGIILVPLYLVIREVKTNHNYSPAIVNVFLLMADLFIL